MKGNSAEKRQFRRYWKFSQKLKPCQKKKSFSFRVCGQSKEPAQIMGTDSITVAE